MVDNERQLGKINLALPITEPFLTGSRLVMQRANLILGDNPAGAVLYLDQYTDRIKGPRYRLNGATTLQVSYERSRKIIQGLESGRLDFGIVIPEIAEGAEVERVATLDISLPGFDINLEADLIATRPISESVRFAERLRYLSSQEERLAAKIIRASQKWAAKRANDSRGCYSLSDRNFGLGF